MRLGYFSSKRAEKFLSCRVGVAFGHFEEDLDKVIEKHQIGERGNFIVTPIAPPRMAYYDGNNQGLPDAVEGDEEFGALPDLAASPETWETKIAISIGQLPCYSSDHDKAIDKFDKLFRHALYLPTPVIIIDCPKTNLSQFSVASVINKRLDGNCSEKLILIKVPLRSRPKPSILTKSPSCITNNNGFNMARLRKSMEQKQETKPANEITDDTNSESGICSGSVSPNSQEKINSSKETERAGWACWNTFRNLLVPDHRIGLCLEILDDLDTDLEKLARWTGEPVRMVSLSTDRFASKEGFKNSMRPIGGIKEFLRMVALANSLNTSFTIQARPDFDIQEHVVCLSNLCDHLDQDHSDCLRAWNDIPLSPLQPLSTNLDSSTYQVFERDFAKYNKYHEAMLEALDFLMMRKESHYRSKFVIMILGAGRGPLVDSMIRAIHKLKLRHKYFKIYALDKNYSSIRSLKYKKRRSWDDFLPSVEVEVVEADMRVWEPQEKADIIATELLGSFSDNELSPECLDGVWRFSTKDTISIPESYSSYLAPICSYRMFQEMHKSREFFKKTNPYDEIQVVRLTNYYTISEPQELFSFEHSNLAKEPVEGANQREVTLTFRSKVETACHGFAGYFSAKLFGGCSISTVPEIKTPTMESWFPAYIPLEKPILLTENSRLEVKFSRKESSEKVWYEWIVLRPEESRLYSPNGLGSAMSKFI